LLVDADDQGSPLISRRCGRSRSGTPAIRRPSARARGPHRSPENGGKVRGHHHRRRGRDNEGLRAALTVANVVLIPLQPSSFDVGRWTLWSPSQGKQEREFGLQLLALLNAADRKDRPTRRR